MSWSTRNLAIEAASLQHTKSVYFAYAIPTPNGLTFHMFLVSDLTGLYNAKNRLPRGDGSFTETWVYPHRIIGDQGDNHAVLVPKAITESLGQTFWNWSKQLKQAT